MAKKRKEATPHLRIRIEPELLARLEKSRTANHRTLTGEIVHRIEQTYRKEDDADLATLVYREAFGERTGDLLRAFATAIWLTEKRTGKKWHQDNETAYQVYRAIGEITQWFSWQSRDPALDAAFLKYRDLPVFRENSPGDPEAVANAAALETLQKMGMAPPDREIDEAAAKYRADPQRLVERVKQANIEAYLKQEREWLAGRRQTDEAYLKLEREWLAERRKQTAEAGPKAKDDGEKK